MGVLKGIGYILASILVLSLIVGGVLLVATLAAFGGVILLSIVVVVFVAICIQECFENATSRKDPR